MTIRSLTGVMLLLFIVGHASGQVPLVYLDHVGIAVDSATYAAISASSFVRDSLAGTRHDSATTEDGTWSGMILTGENSFIGLSSASRRSELVLRCEQLGCSGAIAQMLNTMTSGSAKSELRHRMHSQGATPWYYKTWTEDAQSETFSCWFSEPFPDSTLPDNALGRKAMNARWYKAARLLNNIVKVTVALESPAIRNLTHRLSAFRFGAMFTGSTTVLRGPDIQIDFVPKAGGGVTRIVFALNKPKKGPKEYRFGPTSVLTFDNAKKLATWTF